MLKTFCFIILLFVGDVLATPFHFTLLHTNDLHSHFEGSGPDALFTSKVGDGDPVVGHHARIAYQIKKIKKESLAVERPVLLVDAGDFFSGSLFHILGPSPKHNIFPEFEFFHLMGYDAVTLGNHEFDAYDEGLLNMLEKVQHHQFKVPLVSSNLWFRDSKSPLKKYYGENNLIRQSFVKEYKSKGQKLKVGFIGLLGPDGSLVSTSRRKSVSFWGYDDIEAEKDWDSLYRELQKVVNQLRNEKKVDIVIAIMHGGTPEDNKIAQNTKGIDVLIAGHTHEAYPFPRFINGTIISQAGCYGEYLGRLDLSYEQGEVKLHAKPGGTLVSINDKTPVDQDFFERIIEYKKVVNQIMKRTGYRYDSPIFTATREIKRKRKLHDELGILVTSAIQEGINKGSKEPIDFYFTSLALIRNNIILKGGEETAYQFSDIFSMIPIGFDENFYPGAPIVTFYLNKEEVRDLILFLEIYSKFTPSFMPAFSKQLKFDISSWGIPFLNRVKDMELYGVPYEKWPDLIHIGTSRIVAGYFQKVKKLSRGLVEFIPKDKEGRPLTSIQFNPDLPREYKLLADYLKKYKLDSLLE